MLGEYQMKTPSRVYAGIGVLDEVTRILEQERPAKVALLTDKGIVETGLHSIVLDRILAAGISVVLIDDIVDTAGTITKAANIMLEAGALSVRAIASHCVMSDPASERIQDSALEEIVFTDSIPYTHKCAKVKQLTIADLFAETIRRVVNNESISSQYII